MIMRRGVTMVIIIVVVMRAGIWFGGMLCAQMILERIMMKFLASAQIRRYRFGAARLGRQVGFGGQDVCQ
mgnify:CR=1 FL=1